MRNDIAIAVRVCCWKPGAKAVRVEQKRGVDICRGRQNRQQHNINARNTRNTIMKTINLITLTVVAGSLVTFTARAGIVGSPHDFSSQSWNTDPSDPATV